MRYAAAIILTLSMCGLTRADEKASSHDNTPPEGFTALFNGKDLSGWQGLVELPDRAKITSDQLAKKQELANKKYLPHWTVTDRILNYNGNNESPLFE